MNKNNFIAHRGYQLLYPENTLPAMEAAITAGALRIETDIQLTADGVPVLFHDENLKRLCNKKGAVHDYSAKELTQFSAYEPKRFGGKFKEVKIATLEQLVQLLISQPSVTAYVEIKIIAIKKHGLEKTVNSIIDTLSPIKERCVLISFSLEAISYAWDINYSRLGLVLETWEQCNSSVIKKINPEVLFFDYKKLPVNYPTQLPTAPLAIYEVGTIPLAKKLLANGISYVETFAIGAIISAL